MDREPLPEGEDSDEGSGRPSARARLVRILLIAILVVGGVVVYFCVRAAQKPPETRGLKLLDTVAHMPSGSFKTYEMLLPCAGTLSVEIMAEKENSLSAFLVAPGELVKMKARQTFRHVEGFDGNVGAKYRRFKRLTPGRYCLVLIDNSSGPSNASTVDAQVSARLSGLK